MCNLCLDPGTVAPLFEGKARGDTNTDPTRDANTDSTFPRKSAELEVDLRAPKTRGKRRKQDYYWRKICWRRFGATNMDRYYHTRGHLSQSRSNHKHPHRRHSMSKTHKACWRNGPNTHLRGSVGIDTIQQSGVHPCDCMIKPPIRQIIYIYLDKYRRWPGKWAIPTPERRATSLKIVLCSQPALSSATGGD